MESSERACRRVAAFEVAAKARPVHDGGRPVRVCGCLPGEISNRISPSSLLRKPGRKVHPRTVSASMAIEHARIHDFARATGVVRTCWQASPLRPTPRHAGPRLRCLAHRLPWAGTPRHEPPPCKGALIGAQDSARIVLARCAIGFGQPSRDTGLTFRGLKSPVESAHVADPGGRLPCRRCSGSPRPRDVEV
jgi:hypothetical protein